MSAEVLNERPCGLLRFAGDRCCRHQSPRCAVAWAPIASELAVGWDSACRQAVAAHSLLIRHRRAGAYHFGHPGSDASAQAHHFASFVGPLKKGDFAVLDIENSDKVSPAKCAFICFAPTKVMSSGPAKQLSSCASRRVASWCKQFVDTVQQLMGLPPGRVWVYTGAWFWNPQAGGSSAVGNHPLWVSGYVKTAPPMPKVRKAASH